MNDDPRDSNPDTPMDRDLMNYLDEILHDPAAARSVAMPAVAPDNVAPFDVTRTRKPEPGVSKSKPEPAQAVTLPFRAAERSRVLVSPSLLNLKPAPPEPAPLPEPASPTAEARQEPEPSAPEPVPALPDESSANEKLPDVREWQDNGRPDWAQGRFECLIFNVAGLRMAVPLITLGAIHRIDRKFNALPHQSDWFLGILQTAASGNIKVLDTALCVMPERYDPASRADLAYVITIHGYNWGLACHDVEQSITLEPDQVKWRTQRGKRPWLAGTVIDQMCALIDTDGFHDVILRAERSG